MLLFENWLKHVDSHVEANTVKHASIKWWMFLRLTTPTKWLVLLSEYCQGPSSSVGRVCDPCTKALSSLQRPGVRVQPLPFAAYHPPSLIPISCHPSRCPINKSMKRLKTKNCLSHSVRLKFGNSRRAEWLNFIPIQVSWLCKRKS